MADDIDADLGARNRAMKQRSSVLLRLTRRQKYEATFIRHYITSLFRNTGSNPHTGNGVDI
jgi:hypothetical protein